MDSLQADDDDQEERSSATASIGIVRQRPSSSSAAAAPPDADNGDESCRSREWDLIRLTGRGRVISATAAAAVLDKDEKYNEFCYRVFSWMLSPPAKRQKRSGTQGDEGTKATKKEYTQLYEMLKVYKDAWPQAQSALRYVVGPLPFKTRDHNHILGVTEKFNNKLICPACALFHDRETAPLNGCPRRYCEEQRCIFFEEGRLPDAFDISAAAQST